MHRPSPSPTSGATSTAQAADGRVNVELETDDGMVLNMGPQHPATHGTLRIVARLDGEQVTSADVVCGYMHRGYEKLCEVRSYPQVTTLVNRIDWLGSFANEVPFILAAEQLMEVEAPPRAKWIRTHPLRAQPDRQRQPLHRRPRPPARRPDAGLLRLPRPRVRAQPDRGGHRRTLPPELRPHRRPQGRPAQGLDRRDEGRHGAAARVLRRDGRPRLRQRDLPDPHPRHRGRARPGRAVLRPVRREPARLGRRLGPAARRQHRARLRRARLEGVDPPRRRQLLALLGAPPGGARGHQDRRPAPRRAPERIDHGQGPAHHQGARGRGLRADREPARARWATTSCRGATPGRSG